MTLEQKIATIGLTGGIASGKSAAASFLAGLGVAVVDADVIAREVVLPGEPTLAAIIDAFGDEMLQGDGTLDRAKMASTVFSDAQARSRLNAIIHPAIAQRSLERLVQARARARETAIPYVIYEAPLLIENNIHKGMDGVIVVDVSEATQRARLASRDGLSSEEVDGRLAAQLPLAEKRKHADWLINNNGDLQQLDAEVRRVHEAIRDHFALEA